MHLMSCHVITNYFMSRSYDDYDQNQDVKEQKLPIYVFSNLAGWLYLQYFPTSLQVTHK